LSIFRKSVEKIQVLLNSNKMTDTLHEDRHTFLITSRSVILRMRNVKDKVVEKIKTHILCSVTFSRKSCRLWDDLEKHCRAGQAADDNMAHAHCMLDTYGYKHTLRIFNTYCFSTATMVGRTRLDITLYVPYVACLVYRHFAVYKVTTGLKGKADKKCTATVPVSVPVTWEGGQMMTRQYSNYFIWGGGAIRKVTGSNCHRWGLFW
jgi:hypothetical protein